MKKGLVLASTIAAVFALTSGVAVANKHHDEEKVECEMMIDGKKEVKEMTKKECHDKKGTVKHHDGKHKHDDMKKEDHKKN